MEPKQATEQPTGQWKKSKRKSKYALRQMKGKHNSPKSKGHSKSSSMTEFESEAGLPQEASIYPHP